MVRDDLAEARDRRALIAGLRGEISTNVGAHELAAIRLTELLEAGDWSSPDGVRFVFTDVYRAFVPQLGLLGDPDLINAVVRFYGLLTKTTPPTPDEPEEARLAIRTWESMVRLGNAAIADLERLADDH